MMTERAVHGRKVGMYRRVVAPRSAKWRVVNFVGTLAMAEAVLVTHASVIRSLVAHVTGHCIADCRDVRPPYGSRTRLELSA